MPKPKYHVSMLTSSTDLALSAIPDRFKKLRSVELYAFRDQDFADIPQPSDGDSVSQILSDRSFWGDVRAPGHVWVKEQVARLRTHGDNPINPVSVTAFLPELTSADRNLANAAVQGLLNALKVSDENEIGVVVAVCGRLAEECRRGKDDCQAVIYDAKRPIGWRRKKLDWLVGAMRRTWRSVRAWERNTDIRIALEIEPGMLFVLRQPEDIEYVLKRTSDLRLQSVNGGEEYYFVQVNIDLGHVQLMSPGIDPLMLWRQLFPDGENGTPRNRVANFHISDHPFNTIHCDCAPSLIGYNRMCTRDLEDFAIKARTSGTRPAAPEGFVSWLNCFLCIAENGHNCLPNGLNISLELEAESDPVRVRRGLEVVKKSIRQVCSLRREYSCELEYCLCKNDQLGSCPGLV
jgi:hypothetical protein